jgi:hypothetical protein
MKIYSFTLLLVISLANRLDDVSGTLDINGVKYEAECSCGADINVEMEEATCSPTKCKISKDRAGLGMELDEITRKFEKIADFGYGSIAHESFRCLDGRTRSEGMFTPGGDAGEFILGLLVFEDLS